jgi:signal transduction histidine kinase
MGTVEQLSRSDEETAASALRSLCQLLRTVNSVQLYSDLSDSQPIFTETLDLSALCSALFRELSSLLAAAQVTVTCSPLPGAMVQGNQVLLRRLVLQLVSNALAAGAKELSLHLTATRSKVTLTLTDNGSGIPPHRLATAFSPTQASDQPGENSFNLGLPLCQQIAQAHGGSLMLSSGQNGGTTVSLSLPRFTGGTVTVRAPQADLSGGIPDFLVELSNVLPADFYFPDEY